MYVTPGYEGLRYFDARVVRHDDAADQCTIYPTDTDANRRTTAWLTAQEGSYVRARTMR